jgi:UDP-3-O-[3-hydroxymyristoyl] glucosamine N-acyltransferase
LSFSVAETAVVYPGTVIGDGCQILDYAVVGKQPTLSPRSTAKREPLPPLELGAGTIVSTGAVVFAGTKLGERVIVGDQACVRERVEIGADVVIGRGSLVENDTTVGALTKIQAHAYITAYSDARGRRLHRPCDDDERQLHGPHREAARADQRPDNQARRSHRRGRGSPTRDRDR